MNYEIVISSNTSQKFLNIISKYWAFRNGEFVYSKDQISKDIKKVKESIPDILKYSHCILHVENCRLCNSKFEILIKDRVELASQASNSQSICNLCKTYSPQYQNTKSTSIPIEITINQLSDIEYKILHGIVKLKRKGLIYKHIFNNDLENIEIWNIINKLQKKGLIWIDRTDSCKIRSFRYPEKILKLIK